MSNYATYIDVQTRLNRVFSEDEVAACNAMLADAAIIIDAFNVNAKEEAKNLVSCRMVMRAMEITTADIPIGSTQGSLSALGYSQSWTISNGATGELYLNKMDKKLLGVGNKIGSYSPVEGL